jgi:OmpA-OmpF porin, OOP family
MTASEQLIRDSGLRSLITNNFFMRLMSAGYMLSLVFSAASFSVISQNLVPNFSFEESRICPGSHSQAIEEFRVNHWQSATRGTPDHFHTCSAGEANVPHNWAGVSDAYDGNGYTGIYLWMDNDNQYREYLQCKLVEPLIKDSSYHIEFHYKLSSYSKYAVDRIGLVLTDSLLSAQHDKVLKLAPTLSIIQDSALTLNTGLWEKAAMEYKAKGGEQFLTIGNFFGNLATGFYEVKFKPFEEVMLARSAYYYIDAVKVIPTYLIRREELLLPGFTLPDAVLNTTYVLKNIQFEFASYKLVPPSFDDLALVAQFLIKNPKVKVQFFGHTDDQGSEQYNQKLSYNRAKSAAGYVESLGIEPDRMEVFGFGKNKPLVSEMTQEARAVNRRVEIRFIQ